jgi:hypothetical protein
MGDTDAHLAFMKTIVTQTLPNMYGQYTDLVDKRTTLRAQNTAVQEEVRELEAKHASLQAAADTYDREFLDRGGKTPPSTFWTRRGFQTFHDWLLGALFLVYALVSLALLTYVLFYSKKKLQGGAIVLATAVILGVILVGVISRFA